MTFFFKESISVGFTLTYSKMVVASLKFLILKNLHGECHGSSTKKF